MSEPQTVSELMHAIRLFDCQPSVYTVDLIAHDHMSGFDAVITFRSTHPGSLSSISVHHDVPEQALAILYQQLKDKWGKCPTFGQYRQEKREE